MVLKLILSLFFAATLPVADYGQYFKSNAEQWNSNANGWL
jgi:hypothetical protein